jgi:hypothetical protein
LDDRRLSHARLYWLRLSRLARRRRRSGALPRRDNARGERDKRGQSGRFLRRDHPECRKTQCHQSRNDSHYDAHRVLFLNIQFTLW